VTDASPPRIARLVAVALNAAIDKTAEVDGLVAGEIHRPRLLAALPGGKAVNTARAATRLGLRASVVAVVGGHAGRWFAEELERRSIRARLVDVPGETRTCLSVLDRSTGDLTELYEPGLELPASAWSDVEQALSAELADADGALVVLAGSLPPGAPTDAYTRLAGIAARAGALASVDVAGAPLLAALAARPWLVKLNEAEAAAAIGEAISTDEDAVRAAEALAADATNAIVTRGARGSVLATEDGVYRAAAATERGPYAVGSGDVLLAGLAAALARGEGWQTALAFASAAATANALVPGQGELRDADLDRLVGRTRVERSPRSAVRS